MRAPEVLVSLRKCVVLTDEACNAVEVHAKQTIKGEFVASQRSYQTVACIKRCNENL